MKLKFLILIFIGIVYFNKCQGQWLFGANTGFNFPTNSNYLAIHENPMGNNISLFPSYGKAINMGLQITRYKGSIGFRLDVSYNFGGSIQTDHIINNIAGNHRIKTNISGNNLSFSPLFLLKYPIRKKNIYLFMGPIIAVCKAIKKTSEVDFYNTTQWQQIETMTGNLALGVKAGIGFDYNIRRNTCVFLEMQNNSLNYKPAKLEHEEIFPSYSKSVFYYHKNVNRSKPSNSINQIALPFSSLGLIIGVRKIL
ncbi:MAG: hypothetical protein SGJ10_08370 [Bacteroidota bacterium]|nr:hypothetical protein [Bacteroidota bacterium]